MLCRCNTVGQCSVVFDARLYRVCGRMQPRTGLCAICGLLKSHTYKRSCWSHVVPQTTRGKQANSLPRPVIFNRLSGHTVTLNSGPEIIFSVLSQGAICKARASHHIAWCFFPCCPLLFTLCPEATAMVRGAMEEMRCSSHLHNFTHELSHL